MWGRKPAELLDPIKKCIAKLRWALETYLRLTFEREQGNPVYESVRKIVVPVGSEEEPDKFGAAFETALTEIEEFAGPHLNRKPETGSLAKFWNFLGL